MKNDLITAVTFCLASSAFAASEGREPRSRRTRVQFLIYCSR
jgi:hypothetical protein